MDNKWLDILQKLMAKAEDAATTMEERNSIVEKMTFLMAKHGIEAAMLNASQAEPETVVSVRFELKAPYANQKVTMLYAIASTFGGRAIMLSGEKPKIVMRIFGYPSDIEKIFMLNGSLSIQLLSSLAGAAKPANVHGKSFNASFVVGYVNTVSERVIHAYAQAKESVQNSTTGSGMELVLKTRQESVFSAFRDAYPRTGKYNTVSRATSGVGYTAGQSAGRNANIGQTGLGGGRRAIG